LAIPPNMDNSFKIFGSRAQMARISWLWKAPKKAQKA